MRKFNVKINGKAYEVEVDEVGGIEQPTQPAQMNYVEDNKQSEKKEVKTSVPTDGEKVSAPMPGNILDVKAAVGDRVEKGQVLLILEAMKMENEIVAPVAGTVTAVLVQKGASVNSGDVLVSIS